MNVWTYDKTFDGFLTLVFDCYDRKIFPDKILGSYDDQASLFPENYEVVSDEKRAKRVWNGLHKRISENSCRMLFYVFLSEMPDIEIAILHYIRKVFESPVNIEMNFGDKEVLEMFKTGRKYLQGA